MAAWGFQNSLTTLRRAFRQSSTPWNGGEASVYWLNMFYVPLQLSNMESIRKLTNFTPILAALSRVLSEKTWLFASFLFSLFSALLFSNIKSFSLVHPKKTFTTRKPVRSVNLLSREPRVNTFYCCESPVPFSAEVLCTCYKIWNDDTVD